MGTIIGNIIVALLALAGSVYGTYKANSKNQALIAYRLEQLEKKVDKHNSAVERTYELERKMDVLEEKMSVANHRIADLEDDAK